MHTQLRRKKQTTVNHITAPHRTVQFSSNILRKARPAPHRTARHRLNFQKWKPHRTCTVWLSTTKNRADPYRVIQKKHTHIPRCGSSQRWKALEGTKGEKIYTRVCSVRYRSVWMSYRTYPRVRYRCWGRTELTAIEIFLVACFVTTGPGEISRICVIVRTSWVIYVRRAVVFGFIRHLIWCGSPADKPFFSCHL